MADTQPKPVTAARFKRPESVLVVVYTRTGKVLMLKRADHAEFWQSVTGSLEWQNETPLITAQRELFEETGIEPAGMREWGRTNRYEILPQWRYKYAPGVTHNTEHVFSLELADEVPVHIDPKEHVDYVWLDFADAAARATSWTNRDVIAWIGDEVAARAG